MEDDRLPQSAPSVDDPHRTFTVLPPPPQAPSIFGRLSLKSPQLRLRLDVVMRGLSSSEGPDNFAGVLTRGIQRIAKAKAQVAGRVASPAADHSSRSSRDQGTPADVAADAAATQLMFWSLQASGSGPALYVDEKGALRSETQSRIAAALRSKQPLQMDLLAKPEERGSDVLHAIVTLHFHLISDGLRSETVFSTSHPYAALLEGVFLSREDALAYARLYSDADSSPQDALAIRPTVNSHIAVLADIDPREDFVRTVEEVGTKRTR